MVEKKNGPKKEHGNYIVLDGQKIVIKKHPTDFSVQAPVARLEVDANRYQGVARLSDGMSRARGRDKTDRDALMDTVR